MGPFFARAARRSACPAWVVERLWLGLIFALAVWGMLRLLDVLIGRPRGVAHVVAAAFYLLNPYTLVFTARTTITLLGYAALPWLLLITHHGLRADARVAWLAAVVVGRRRSRSCSPPPGGGVNAAVVGLDAGRTAGAAPLRAGHGDGALARQRAASWSASACSACSRRCGGSCPLLVHVQYGIDFLQFTEQPGTIWGTNSITESLRLMGYWTSYIGVGFGVTPAVTSPTAARCSSTRWWWARRCCCPRWRWPASSGPGG